MKYMFIFIIIIVVPLKLGQFLVYATTLAFLPLLEALLKLTSSNCVQDSPVTVPEFGDILETTSS